MADLALPLSDLLQTAAMTLATVGVDGQPHAAPVYFAALVGAGSETEPLLRLYFFSDPQSQHALDTGRSHQAAAAVYPECEGWQDIRGLQMRGEVRRVEPGPEWERAWALYLEKFPFVGDLKAIVAQNAMYVFTPSWVRLVDNRRGFGFKEEWTVP